MVGRSDAGCPSARQVVVRMYSYQVGRRGGKALISVPAGRFVHDCGEELLLIPRCATCCQYAIPDTTRGEMVQHCVIWHDEHTGIIPHWRISIQNALS